MVQYERVGLLERTVGQVREANVTLTRQVAELTVRVAALLMALDAATSGDDPGTTGEARRKGCPITNPPRSRIHRPPTHAAHTIVRAYVRMTPTAQVIHALDPYPTCGMTLTGGSAKRTRDVIEVSLIPAVVTEHVYLERCCPAAARATHLRARLRRRSRASSGSGRRW